MKSWRIIVGAVAAAVSVTVGFAPPAEAGGHRGFVDVRSSAAVRASIAAVGGGEVWVAGTADNGQVRLEHRKRGTWTTSQLPVTADETLQLHATGPRNVWLVSGGQLWHYRTSWRRVTLPRSELATAVFDPPGKDLYVGTYHTEPGPYGTDVVARLFRFDGRQWKATGGPELPDDWKQTGTKIIKSVKVTRGQVYATVLWHPPAAVVINDTYRVDGATWTSVVRTFMRSGGGVMQLGAWLSYRDGVQVFIGTADPSPGPSSLLCDRVTSAGDVTACPPASGGVSAGVLPDRGPAVLGGQDWNAWENNTVVPKQGRFLLRERNGVERVLSGDPGDTTVAMSIDPANSEVWAITKAGDQYSVQRYRR